MHGREGARVGRLAIGGCLALVLLGLSAACSVLVDTTGLANGSAGADSGSGGDGGGSSGDGAPPPGDGEAPTGSTYRDAVMADGPLAYYRLDERTEGVVKDETGRFDGAHEGSLSVGAPPLLGGSEAAVTFDESGAIVIEGLEGTVPFTVELWLSKSAPPSQGFHAPFLMQTGTGTNGRGYAILVEDDSVTGARLVEGTAAVEVLASGIAVGRVVHVAMTYSGATLALYVDGVLAEEKSDMRVVEPFAAPAIIGGEFDGTVDEVAVYDKALSPERIQAHFAARVR